MLVPIRVGMILNDTPNVKVGDTCPHTRGDDPYSGSCQRPRLNLSPHAWG